MSSLLAHIKIVEGQEQKFEELSKDIFQRISNIEESVK